MRLNVAPSRLVIDTASLLVLTDDEALPPADQVPWDRWWEKARSGAMEAGIDLLANQYESFASLNARDYRSAVELEFDYLSRGA